MDLSSFVRGLARSMGFGTGHMGHSRSKRSQTMSGRVYGLRDISPDKYGRIKGTETVVKASTVAGWAERNALAAVDRQTPSKAQLDHERRYKMLKRKRAARRRTRMAYLRERERLKREGII